MDRQQAIKNIERILAKFDDDIIPAIVSAVELNDPALLKLITDITKKVKKGQRLITSLKD